ncbi:MAG: FtsW/RodA/SpoVE family cell cycle protein [Candidatus Contendobacter sp.]|jgi:cell division protein FtsW|nr:FtsW/RodA/SpoVE family cell cycle protein [Gammaproteobacteria bacterium]MCC8993196.1 FtsW/RodA/SpoVE family cell cycle protein [Candidatus Contendobacter sp.]
MRFAFRLLIGLLPALGIAWTVGHAPIWLEPRLLTVPLEPGQSLTLGREALWAPQADSVHLQLRRDLNGGWQLANLAPGKSVIWRPASERDDQTTRQWLLTPGAAFTVGTQALTVLIADPERFTLQSGDQSWDYDGFRLQRNGQPLPECYPGWRSSWRDGLAILGLGKRVKRPLRLGGGVYCADRLGLPGTPVDTAMIISTGAGFALRPGDSGRADGLPVIVAAGTPEAESLWQRAVPLAVGDSLIVGRTHYRVTQTSPTLQLAVLARAQRWPAESEPPVISPVVVTQWRPIAWWWPVDGDSWPWPLGLALPALAIGWFWPKRRMIWQIAGALALAGAGLGAYVSRETLPTLWPYLLAWSALLVWLMTVRSRWSVGLLATLGLLLGSGLMALLQLGVGAGESGWLRYGGGNAALAGAFGWLAWAIWNGWRWWRPVNGLEPHWVDWGLRGLNGVALTLLTLQIGFGNERGWAGLQPFELTKLALLTAAAYALTVLAKPGGSDRSGNRSRWLRYLGPLGLLAAVSSFALLFLRDFSPLALLSLWSLAMMLAWLGRHPHPHHRRFGQRTIIGLTLMVVVGLAWLHQYPQTFPLNFQADRIRVWAAPEQYPHAGYQLRRALELIRAGGWQGTVWNDPANGRIMTLPAVQNDFTLAFFLNRYGGGAGLVLVALQVALMALLLGMAGRCFAPPQRCAPLLLIQGGENAPRGSVADERRSGLGPFAGFALYGGAAWLGAHFLVSWGTNLGFLPVMGQPMPLLSAAGSHLTLLILPVLALAIAVEEQNHDDSH